MKLPFFISTLKINFKYKNKNKLFMIIAFNVGGNGTIFIIFIYFLVYSYYVAYFNVTTSHHMTSVSIMTHDHCHRVK